MYGTTPLSIPTNAEKLFNFLLLFYPQQYRKKFGQEMFLLFRDIYQEELTKKGSVSLAFWFTQFGDITKSVIEQHIDMIGKQGMKKYLQQIGLSSMMDGYYRLLWTMDKFIQEVLIQSIQIEMYFIFFLQSMILIIS